MRHLRIEKLNKTYANGIHALVDVSLTIPTGMFGLLGPNGAGKSTLMRTIATLQEPDSGEVVFDNIDVLREKFRVKAILGYLPQEFGFYGKDRAEDLLEHFALLKGLRDRATRKSRVEELLKRVNLYDARRKKLGTYSGGMKQRFGIAQALLGDPQLIIVDEPTAGLDPAERRRFHNLLSEIGEELVIILSTHIVEDVSDLCRHMAIIDKGRVLMTGNPSQAITAIRGRVWEKKIDKADLPDIRDAFRVLSSRMFAGNTYVRVYAQSDPGDGFQAAIPALEDVYFYELQQGQLDEARD